MCRVHKQRQHYAKGNETFMKTKAIKLDEIGFEWTPRGNTKIKWEDGMDLLVSSITLSFALLRVSDAPVRSHLNFSLSRLVIYI